ncbi:MAG TPA: YidB family protein, partial [Gemmatimonadales bacterium]|nr:YidB family protein [Gemmatimonadales bacterium]
AAATHPDLVPELMRLLNGVGGVAGLVQMFSQGGLGHIAQSWVGTGNNLPVSASQIEQVLGSGQLQALAGKLGLPAGALSQQLTQVLPHLVDTLTPNGQVPQGDVLGEAMGALKKLL